MPENHYPQPHNHDTSGDELTFQPDEAPSEAIYNFEMVDVEAAPAIVTTVDATSGRKRVTRAAGPPPFMPKHSEVQALAPKRGKHYDYKAKVDAGIDTPEPRHRREATTITQPQMDAQRSRWKIEDAAKIERLHELVELRKRKIARQGLGMIALERNPSLNGEVTARAIRELENEGRDLSALKPITSGISEPVAQAKQAPEPQPRVVNVVELHDYEDAGVSPRASKAKQTSAPTEPSQATSPVVEEAASPTTVPIGSGELTQRLAVARKQGKIAPAAPSTTEAATDHGFENLTVADLLTHMDENLVRKSPAALKALLKLRVPAGENVNSVDAYLQLSEAEKQVLPFSQFEDIFNGLVKVGFLENPDSDGNYRVTEATATWATNYEHPELLDEDWLDTQDHEDDEEEGKDEKGDDTDDRSEQKPQKRATLLAKSVTRAARRGARVTANAARKHAEKKASKKAAKTQKRQAARVPTDNSIVPGF